MKLNELKPNQAAKSNKSRKARGVGSGLGKTAGRGHTGQLSRTGSGPAPGFEGGQMPYHRRLPKFGFTSRKSLTRQEVSLDDLKRVGKKEVTIDDLKEANIIRKSTQDVKVIYSGSIDKSIDLKGIKVTKGAQEQIEQAGGTVS